MSLAAGHISLLPRRVVSHAAGALKALGHPDRLRLVELLSQGEQVVKDLARAARLRPHIASQHLKELRAAGVVTGRKDGRRVWYRLTSPEAAAAVHALRRLHQTKASFQDGEAI